MNINGKTRIFRQVYDGRVIYSTSISNKLQDGTYERMYISAQLPKETNIENNTEIEITKGFLSFYKNSKGLAIPKLVIQEYIQNGDAAEPEYTSNETDLPF